MGARALDPSCFVAQSFSTLPPSLLPGTRAWGSLNEPQAASGMVRETRALAAPSTHPAAALGLALALPWSTMTGDLW